MRRLGLACAALIVLSACGSDPKPIEPTAAASRATLEKPRASMKPPQKPEAIKRNDETGAANFVLYWVKVSDYASLTGDTGLLREISAQDCAGCARYIDLYTRTYEQDGWIKGGTNKLDDVSVEQVGETYIVRARVSSAPGRFKRRSHEPAIPTPAEKLNVSYAAVQTRGQWSMIQVGLER